MPWRRAWQPTPVFLPEESPWTEESGGLQSMGSQRVGHDWVTKHNTAQHTHYGLPWWSGGKESAWNAGDPGSIPDWERSLGEGNGYPLQYSCLENPVNRGTWCATVHGVTVRHDWVNNTFTHSICQHYIYIYIYVYITALSLSIYIYIYIHTHTHTHTHILLLLLLSSFRRVWLCATP